MEKEPNEKLPSDNRRGYIAKPIKEDCWFALVDTGDGTIFNIYSFVEDAREVLAYELLPDLEDDWRKAQGKPRGADIPCEVQKALHGQYAIVRCTVTVKRGESYWRTS